MTFNHRKAITFRLAQAAKAYRARAGSHLGRIGLHAGQEQVLKALAEQDGQTMSQLAQELGVQPPTVTKMVTRMSGQGLLRRATSDSDGRLARVHLTEEGRNRLTDVDKAWKRVEREALVGFDDKDRKRLRRLLRALEANLVGEAIPEKADEVETVETDDEEAAE